MKVKTIIDWVSNYKSFKIFENWNTSEDKQLIYIYIYIYLCVCVCVCVLNVMLGWIGVHSTYFGSKHILEYGAGHQTSVLWLKFSERICYTCSQSAIVSSLDTK
jgi:hypothetical protein